MDSLKALMFVGRFLAWCYFALWYMVAVATDKILVHQYQSWPASGICLLHVLILGGAWLLLWVAEKKFLGFFEDEA